MQTSSLALLLAGQGLKDTSFLSPCSSSGWDLLTTQVTGVTWVLFVLRQGHTFRLASHSQISFLSSPWDYRSIYHHAQPQLPTVHRFLISLPSCEVLVSRKYSLRQYVLSTYNVPGPAVGVWSPDGSRNMATLLMELTVYIHKTFWDGCLPSSGWEPYSDCPG